MVKLQQPLVIQYNGIEIAKETYRITIDTLEKIVIAAMTSNDDSKLADLKIELQNALADVCNEQDRRWRKANGR